MGDVLKERTMIMNNDYFRIDKEIGLFICKICKIGIKRSKVQSHIEIHIKEKDDQTNLLADL